MVRNEKSSHSPKPLYMSAPMARESLSLKVDFEIFTVMAVRIIAEISKRLETKLCRANFIYLFELSLIMLESAQAHDGSHF